MTSIDETDQAPTLDRATELRKTMTDLGPRLRSPGALLVPVWRDRSLIAPGRPARPAMLRAESAGDLVSADGSVVWLGLWGGADCFALELPPSDASLQHPALEGHGEFRDLRLVGGLLRHAEAGLLAYARGMVHWHRHNQHCGRCGTATQAHEGGHMRECASCGEKAFPRTDPAVMALVTHEGRCLLARQATFPAGMYSVLAGFVEPGETIEEAVAREVREEVGLHVTDIRYLRSQPWPFPSSLMLGFAARATSGEVRGGDGEIEDARWFTRAEIRSPSAMFIPPPFSLANQLISLYLDEG